jgi:hypothetical protein
MPLVRWHLSRRQWHQVGIAALVLVAISPFCSGLGVITFFFALLFSIGAAINASRWWLLLTGSLVLLVALGLIVGLDAR